LGARKVIEKFYPKSIPKPQPTFHEGMKSNNKIVLHDVPSDKYEAWLIAKLTSEKLEEGNEVKVIIPNSNYFPVLKEAFTKARIDYRYRRRPDMDGLLRFTALADWIKDPKNNLHLRYLLDLAIQNHDLLVKTVASQTPKITEKRTSASEQISRLWHRVSRQSSLYNVLSAAAESDGSESFLSKLLASLEEIRNLIYTQGNTIKAISPFFGISALLLAPGKNPNSFINEIKEWANDLFGTDSSKTTGTVNIYNMPSSKGLEADIIFVTGLSESLFPREKLKSEEMEELSRLFFVAMTRAQKELHLFNARLRSGSITLLPDSFQLKPSRFIKAIPKDHLEVRYYQVES
jgi:superfamily I DNA/RNA helicase